MRCVIFPFDSIHSVDRGDRALLVKHSYKWQRVTLVLIKSILNIRWWRL